MNSSRKPEELRETVEMIGRVRSAQELDNLNMRNRVRLLFDVVQKCSQKKIAEPAASQFIKAFLSWNPSKAYRNLVKLHSGRSLCDHLSLSETAVPLDLEDQQSDFSIIYRDFNSSYLNAMTRRPDVCDRYRAESCVEAALWELSTTDYKQHRDDSPAESSTAHSIVTHLLLLYKVSTGLSLEMQRRVELKKKSYFPILKEFTLSRYVPLVFSGGASCRHISLKGSSRGNSQSSYKEHDPA